MRKEIVVRRCARCIMPETAKGIKFDNRGECQLCRDYKEFVPEGEQELHKKVEQCRKDNKNPDFDCIVPVSGGRDSAYALYYAKRVLGLRPLAVHNDNDFETPIANQNLESITKSLDVPIIRANSKMQILKKIVAAKFTMNAPYGAGLIVDQTCEACKYGFESASYNTARNKGINLVIWGDSTDESTVPYHTLIKNEHKHPSKWDRLLSGGALGLLQYKRLFNRMKKEYGSDSPAGVNEIRLYDYVRWDQRVIVDTIQKELDWKKPEESPTSWRVDCSLVPLVNYLTYKAYGVSKLEIGFSNMVRSGKMDRDDAIEQAETINKNTDVQQLKWFVRGMNVAGSTIKKVLI